MYQHAIQQSYLFMSLPAFALGQPGVCFLADCKVTSQIQLLCGDRTDGIAISFAKGRKDAYAVILIRYYKDCPPMAYYPNDTDWLSCLGYLVQNQWIRCDMLLQCLVDLMQCSVGQRTVRHAHLCRSYECSRINARNQSDIWVSLYVWLSWFLYACVSEENYISPSGGRTRIGGLIKIAAYIEYVMEGMPLQDACDHYQTACFASCYHGQGSPADAVEAKCRQYGIIRYTSA